MPNLSTIADEKLVERICQGDKELFGELIDRYEAKLTRYVKKFTQNVDDVSDIVQTIFIKGYTNLQSFDTSRSFNSWIYRIAHNESVNHLKKRGGEKVSFIDFDTFFPHPFAKETADKETLSGEEKQILEKSLKNISPKYREVLILYFYEELTYQDIADVLRIPIATVGVRIRRGKEALKEALTTNHYQS
ncbi:MAG: polymerase sigma-70 factor, subfamily [Patescibacteria group bacterium]|nr:polymerase sigma-70 factor, subfamily [Patescibacteria group bacterium]